MKLKLERDRSLVSSPCFRLRTAVADHFVWWQGWRPRHLRYELEAQS